MAPQNSTCQLTHSNTHITRLDSLIHLLWLYMRVCIIVRDDRDSRATLMPIYGDLYQIKL